MSEETKGDIYRTAVLELEQLHKKQAYQVAKLKRIGKNFEGLGADLINRPWAVSLDKLLFDADTVEVHPLLSEYAGTCTKLAEKRREVAAYGPVPSFE